MITIVPWCLTIRLFIFTIIEEATDRGKIEVFADVDYILLIFGGKPTLF